MSETSSIDSSKHQVEDPLTRKHTATFNRQSRSESGRLLSIIAKQAVIGRNHEVSKVFHVALVYVLCFAVLLISGIGKKQYGSTEKSKKAPAC